MPKFSIIIPVYNVAHPASARFAARRDGSGDTYLRECLDSVLAQTFTDWEAICVDDGSTDGSGEILDEYAARDARIRVIHQKNAGVSAARNVALDVAQGEWIWFVDGDDIIDRRSLETLFAAIAKFSNCQLHAVFLECHVFKDGGRPADSLRVAPDMVYYGTVSASITRKFFRPASRTLLRRAAIGSVRFKGYQQNEDALFVMEYLCRGTGWVTINAPLYFYRMREGSSSHNNTYTAEMVEKIFDSENELLSAALQLRDANPGCDLTGLFADLHTRSYYTYCYWYFGLTAKERRRLLPKWIALQCRFVDLYRWPVARRIRFTAVRFFRSGYLVKPLVVGSVPGFAHIKRLFLRMSKSKQRVA